MRRPREALRESERGALGCARAVVVTSEPTAEILAPRLRRAAERITVIRPGVDRVAAAAPRPQAGDRRQSAQRRIDHTAQGLRHPDRGAGQPEGIALAPHHRRRHHAQRHGLRAAAGRYRALAVCRIGSSIAGAVTEARLAELYAERGRLRAGLAVRRLRHGVRRGDRAWPADRRDRRRRRAARSCRRTPACSLRRVMRDALRDALRRVIGMRDARTQHGARPRARRPCTCPNGGSRRWHSRRCWRRLT